MHRERCARSSSIDPPPRLPQLSQLSSLSSEGVGLGSCSCTEQELGAAAKECVCTEVSEHCFVLRRFISQWIEELKD